MRLLLFCVALWIGGGSAQEFQGCFKDLNFANGIERNFRQINLNADCAEFCGSQGYILAATQANFCHCTNIVPTTDDMVTSPNQLKLIEGNNGDSPCNTPCPGTLIRSPQRCIGDECCGGKSGTRKRYSLYAVGGINPVSVLLRRIYRSLMTRDHSSWLDGDVVAADMECSDDFIEVTYEHGYLRIDKDLHELTDYQELPRISSVEECQDKCRESLISCQSITYSFYNNVCTLNLAMSSVTGFITLSERHTAIYDRNCSRAVEVLPMNFQLEMAKQSIREFSMGGSVEASDDAEDFEVDLTSSNNWETSRRSVTMSSSQEVSTNTQSGFVKSSAISRSQGSTHANTQSTSLSNSATQGKEYGFGVSVGTSVSAEASFGFGSVSGSVEAKASFDHQRSSSDTTESNTDTSNTETNSAESSSTDSRSDIFNLGYSQTTQRDNSQFFDYSMTVPAYHKGIMNFLVEKQLRVKKITTDLRLNGYLQLKVRDGQGHEEVREVHVARILSPSDRRVSTMSEQIYTSPMLIAKVTITDPQGITVMDEKQMANRDY